MCGLVYSASLKNKPVNRQVIEQYEKQKTRGRQGFGVFDGNFEHLIRKTKEEDILKWLHKYKSTEILFHHRFPTSTDNIQNACHPFSTKDHFKTNYILIHNGHITNAQMLKGEHAELGIEYYSTQSDGRFNDSEALLWDLALYLEGKQESLESYGNIAFICIAIKGGKKKLYFGRNVNPLFMRSNKKGVFLASVYGSATNQVTPHSLYTFDFESKNLTTTPLRLRSYWADQEDKKEAPVIPRSGEGKNPWTPQSYAAQQGYIKDDKNNITVPPESDEDTEYNENDEPKYIYDDGIVYDDVYDPKNEADRKAELHKTYLKYITNGEGYYFMAIKNLRADIKDYDQLRWESTNQDDLQDIIDMVSILRSVKDAMLIDPNYKKFNSRHPSYASQKEIDDKQLKLLESA